MDWTGGATFRDGTEFLEEASRARASTGARTRGLKVEARGIARTRCGYTFSYTLVHDYLGTSVQMGGRAR